MFKTNAAGTPSNIPSDARPVSRRRGGILVISAFVAVMVFAFAAFTVDFGFVVLVKQQLQTASDAAALAAAQELITPLELGVAAGSPAETAALATARTAAVDVAAEHPNGYSDTTVLYPNSDIQFGNRTWDFATNSWVTTWGVGPYNTVRTKASRVTSNGDSLTLLFAPIIGHQSADVSEESVASLIPGVGFAAGGGGMSPILPFAVDIDSWMTLQGATGPDNWTWDEATGQVSPGPDGVPELKIFPSLPDETLPSGNRGTINIGNPNNSTADLSRQISNGVNSGDFAYHGGSIDFSGGPIVFSGDPGLSAAIKDEVEGIIGEPKALVLYTEVSGNGANSAYTCVRFAGARIMDVKLTGPMSLKRVIVQPAAVFDSHVIAGPTDTTVPGTLYTMPKLTQ
ncbi:MAG: TadE/TadG family type IV pilus assembly protein [Planctomycetales bacterium]